MTPGETGNAHIPVMLGEVLEDLRPTDGAVLVDGTFGGGGYTRALLGQADTRVIGLDRDGAVLAAAAPMRKAFGERLTLVHGRFADMDRLLKEAGVDAVDGVVLDLGVSSIQLDTPERGFSFMRDGPLDMRMGGSQEADTRSAADVVNTESAARLRSILSRYGEERRARAISEAIVARRAEAPFTRTLDLAGLVERVLGRGRKGEIHPATRTFQGLRIYVNRELDELVRALFAAERLLRAGGRLVVVSFHSLEDRIVKTFLTARTGRGGQGSRHAPPTAEATRAPSFTPVVKGVRKPSEAEVADNPRARSAKLRAAERSAALPWPEDWASYNLLEDAPA